MFVTDIKALSLQIVCELFNEKNPEYLKDKTLDEFVDWVFSALDADHDGCIKEYEFIQGLSNNEATNSLAGLLTFTADPRNSVILMLEGFSKTKSKSY